MLLWFLQRFNKNGGTILVWSTVRLRRRVYKLSDLKNKSDEDLLYLYGNLKLAIKEQLHINDFEEV